MNQAVHKKTGNEKDPQPYIVEVDIRLEYRERSMDSTQAIPTARKFTPAM
jgi:hypothetical protein